MRYSSFSSDCCVEIDTCRLMKEASQAAEKRRKAVVVGDLQPLASALPQLTPMAPSRFGRLIMSSVEFHCMCAFIVFFVQQG